MRQISRIKIVSNINSNEDGTWIELSPPRDSPTDKSGWFQAACALVSDITPRGTHVVQFETVETFL